MSSDPTRARPEARWLLILGVWSMAALVSASQAYVRSRGELTWWAAVERQLPGWWIWALLTPICLALARRFPTDRLNWRTRVPVHVAFGTGIVLLYLVLQSPLSVLSEGRVLTWASYRGAVLGGLVFQYLTHFVTYVGIVSIGHVIAYQQRLIEGERQAARLERELSQARLESLRAQLQPHFLFNTLHTIGGFVRSGERADALRMLAGLSGLLRYTLDHLDAPEIPLHQEIEATERYLQIEEVRFRDRLEVVRRIDPRVADALVPALLLQPLLENAVHHGIQGDDGPVEVVLTADLADPRTLRLRVEDDGAGIAPDFDHEAQSGVGLGLSVRRLRSLYGTDHDFSIEPVSPRGTRVVICLPFRTAS